MPKSMTPWLWLQGNEEKAIANVGACRCRLVRSFKAGSIGTMQDEDGPALFQCRLHKHAEKLLEALKEFVDNEWAQDPESRNMRDEHLEEHAALIKKAEGRK